MKAFLEWLKKYRMTIVFFVIIGLFAFGYYYLYNYDADPAGRAFEATRNENMGMWGWLRMNASLIGMFLMLVFVAFFIFFSLRQQKQAKEAIKSEKKTIPIVTEEDIDTRFAHVAGCDEAKAELELLVEFLRNPEKFKKLGATIPRGSLLIGDPGVGKTLLARAVAGEAGVPLMPTSGSEFIEKYVGVGASRIRAMFEAAEARERCIIFIDEIDSIGAVRSGSGEGGHREQGQTINQLLTCMDGFKKTNVIVIAATNRPDVLDPALLRPGRFSQHVVVARPDVRGREQVLNVHMEKVPIGTDVDVNLIARGTPGFSGADLANLVNNAAITAAQRGADHVEMCDFEKAKDKIMMGAERKAFVMSEEERMTTAYHEAGHVLVTHFLSPDVDPLHKVTIIPRGRSLGVTMSVPEQDHYSMNEKQLLAKITVFFGGRIAEELYTGNTTTGATNDFERATELARSMVARFGMAGAADAPEDRDANQLRMMVVESSGSVPFSQATLEAADKETRKILEFCYRRAERIILDHRDLGEVLARNLLEKETLDRSDIEAILGKHTMPGIVLHLSDQKDIQDQQTPQ